MTECCNADLLSVIMLRVVMLNVATKLFMLSVIVLNVTAPNCNTLAYWANFYATKKIDFRNRLECLSNFGGKARSLP